jgi:hypothetical protein
MCQFMRKPQLYQQIPRNIQSTEKDSKRNWNLFGYIINQNIDRYFITFLKTNSKHSCLP